MKAQDMLPDGQDFVVKDGIALRKGSVAAFIANALVLARPDASAEHRQAAERDLLELVPVLDRVGLFEVFELRSHALRELIGRQREGVTRAPVQPS